MKKTSSGANILLILLLILLMGCAPHIQPDPPRDPYAPKQVLVAWHFHRAWVIPVRHKDHVAFYADHKWDEGWFVACAIPHQVPHKGHLICPACGEELTHGDLYFDSRET